MENPLIDFLTNALLYVIPILVILGVVVTVHEMGHFLAARWLGTAVDRFSIGFGKPIASWRDKGGVEWRIGWIPLGGYVRFSGDDNAASIPDEEDLATLRSDLLAIEGEAALGRYFHFKPLWQRAVIVAAGPIANFLLAITVFAVLLMSFGEQFYPARVDGVKAGSPAERAGFHVGDKVLRVNGSKIQGFDDIERTVLLSSGTPIDFLVERGDREIEIQATPERGVVIDALGKPQQLGVLGLIQPARIGGVSPGSPAELAGLLVGDIILRADGKPVEGFADLQRTVLASGGKPLALLVQRRGEKLEFQVAPAAASVTDKDGKSRQVWRLGLGQSAGAEVMTRRYNPLQAVARGTEQCWESISLTVTYLKRVVTGRETAEQLSGPLGMAQVAGDLSKRAKAASPDLAMFARNWALLMVQLVATISVGIGFLNLLPIPVLDGGHLLFYGYEAVARRPLTAKVQAAGYRVGLALVLGLMLFATWNDLQRLRVFNLFGGLFS